MNYTHATMIHNNNMIGELFGWFILGVMLYMLIMLVSDITKFIYQLINN